MTINGFAGSTGPWLAIGVLAVVAALAIGLLVRHGRGGRTGPRALAALPIALFGAVVALLVMLVPYLVILPPTSEPVILAAVVSRAWQGTAAVVGTGWVGAIAAAGINVCRCRARRRTAGRRYV